MLRADVSAAPLLTPTNEVIGRDDCDDRHAAGAEQASPTCRPFNKRDVTPQRLNDHGVVPTRGVANTLRMTGCATHCSTDSMSAHSRTSSCRERDGRKKIVGKQVRDGRKAKR